MKPVIKAKNTREAIFSPEDIVLAMIGKGWVSITELESNLSNIVDLDFDNRLTLEVLLREMEDEELVSINDEGDEFSISRNF